MLACSAGRDPDPRPNLLLVVIDTLRFDHLSLYGYERNTSPALDRLAVRGWVFDGHVSHGAQTVPSTLSILLSQLPAEHGFVHRQDGQFTRSPPLYPSELVFLGEVLMEHGYRTAAFVGNPFLSPANGFDQGFGHFEHAVNADRVLANGALAWLRANGARQDAPFMVYVHLMDVHWPYAPPREYAERYRAPGAGRLVYRNGPAPRVRDRDLHHTVATYDAGINVADDLTGELVAELEALGVAQDTIVAVTSDHGEEFLDHKGLGHGTTVYGELVRVPLILVYPRKLESRRRVRHLTQHLDLAPTLLSLAGIEKPASFRGGDLFEEPDVAFSEEGPWRAAYSEGHKLVWNVATDRVQLFAASDALDQVPVDDPGQAAELRRQLEAYQRLETRAAGSPPPGPDWSASELESLRSLGYVE
jgi:arylsulfatase A-like enzyme